MYTVDVRSTPQSERPVSDQYTTETFDAHAKHSTCLVHNYASELGLCQRSRWRAISRSPLVRDFSLYAAMQLRSSASQGLGILLRMQISMT